MEWIVLAFMSAIFSAIATIFEKKNLFTLDALQFSFVLALLNMVFSIPFFYDVDFATISTTSLFVLYLKTILGALAFLCVMLAIKNMDISGSLPLLVLTPGLVAIFAFLFIDESLSTFEIVGMFLLLIGTYFLEAKPGYNLLYPFKVFYKSKYHHYIIFALLLFTITAILDKVLLKKYQLPPHAFLGFQQIFLAFNFLIIVLFAKKNPVMLIKSIDKQIWGWILVTSILSVGYRYTQIEAVKLAPVALVLSVKRTSVFFAAIGGGKIFNETNLLKKALATAIMIAGAIFIVNN
ncbi:MAG: EamA family transporter [Bacteroidetes bacterium]|nr:EamA family transporter [Bacteroidota bacterium]MBU1116449.1 EamA family transporter [Bacteroidota bacterium]MBU1800028.1 EamA family transporter [Bacteroidota bacterium]